MELLWLERTSGDLPVQYPGGHLAKAPGKPSTVLVVGRMMHERFLGLPRGAQERNKLQDAGKGNPTGYKGKKKCTMRVIKHRSRSPERCSHHLHAQNPNPDLIWKLALL